VNAHCVHAPEDDVKVSPRDETTENESAHYAPTYPHLSVDGNCRLSAQILAATQLATERTESCGHVR